MHASQEFIFVLCTVHRSAFASTANTVDWDLFWLHFLSSNRLRTRWIPRCSMTAHAALWRDGAWNMTSQKPQKRRNLLFVTLFGKVVSLLGNTAACSASFADNKVWSDLFVVPARFARNQAQEISQSKVYAQSAAMQQITINYHRTTYMLARFDPDTLQFYT